MTRFYFCISWILSFLSFYFISISELLAQTYIPADPYYLLLTEKDQFEGKLPLQSNIFRPIFINSDSTSYSLKFKSEGYFNDNAPNQENMDVRYFSKGIGSFYSIQLAYSNSFVSLIAEPYLMENRFSLCQEFLEKWKE